MYQLEAEEAERYITEPFNAKKDMLGDALHSNPFLLFSNPDFLFSHPYMLNPVVRRQTIQND